MSLFLPRESGSIETGPQTFAGTNVLNTTFLFRKEPPPSDPPGLLNSVLVQNGGWSNLNGTFVYTTLFDNKPYYNKDGNGDWFIVWFNNQWNIYDFSEDAVDPIYFSSENTNYPWSSNNWQVQPGYGPTPTVTKVL